MTARDFTILAGSAEGHALARQRPEARALLPAPLRHDPGGVDYHIAEDWQAETLVAQGSGPIILATHPCDASLRADLPALCAAAGRPLLHLIRPAWQPTADDRWHILQSDAEAAEVIPKGARVFVGIGRAVDALRDPLAGRYLIIRQLSAPEAALQAAPQVAYEGEGHFLEGQAPFSEAEERETLRAERIDWLLVRNAGGQGSLPKLKAARGLGLPVAMLPRPALMADVPIAEDAVSALNWLETQ